jgi:hypothetical protein
MHFEEMPKHESYVLEGTGGQSFCAREELKLTLAPKTGSAEELRLSFEEPQDLT